VLYERNPHKGNFGPRYGLSLVAGANPFLLSKNVSRASASAFLRKPLNWTWHPVTKKKNVNNLALIEQKRDYLSPIEGEARLHKW